MMIIAILFFSIQHLFQLPYDVLIVLSSFVKGLKALPIFTVR